MVLSNIRIEENNNKAFLISDLESKHFSEKTIWFSVPVEYKEMLSPEVYDPFVTALLFPAMDLKEDIIVKGCVTKKLYKNINLYVQNILTVYASYLSKINIKIENFSSVKKTSSLIGTGFSAGVDSFSTFYDHYVLEDDEDYKINSLFFFNVGSHGKFSNNKTHDRFIERYNFLKSFPAEIQIPYIPVDSNIHYFHEKYGHVKTEAITIAAAVQVFQKTLKKYYVSNAYNYYEEKVYAMKTFDSSLAEFSEFYLFTLLSPEGLEIISDGGQYNRTEKESRIINYEPVKRYLNVCVKHSNDYISSKNCSCCSKCLRTLMAYDSMNKLNDVKNVFDLNVYKKVAKKYKYQQVLDYKDSGFAKDNIDFLRQNGGKKPSFFISLLVCFPYFVMKNCKIILRKVLGNGAYNKFKQKVKKCI